MKSNIEKKLKVKWKKTLENNNKRKYIEEDKDRM